MSKKLPAPVPRLTVITLGVSNMRASIAFYEALGFARKFKVTGEAVAFFETGGTAIGLFPWDQLAQDATLPEHPRPQTFRGITLAWNCNSVWCVLCAAPRSGLSRQGAHGAEEEAVAF
jgi:catechol 2,3-dioxygenase-like lactoylglutathione lyase family enzyme